MPPSFTLSERFPATISAAQQASSGNIRRSIDQPRSPPMRDAAGDSAAAVAARPVAARSAVIAGNSASQSFTVRSTAWRAWSMDRTTNPTSTAAAAR